LTARRLTVYTPDSPLRQPAALARAMIADLWSARTLAWRLFIRDVSAQYRNSALGYLWVWMPPLMASLPFVLLTSAGVLSIAATPVPYPVYATVGTIVWQTFVDALNSPLKSATAARSMLTRINFPREAILISGLLHVGFACLVRLPVLLAVLLLFGVAPAPTAPLFVVGMVSVALTGFMIGLLLTPVGLLYGDIQHGLPMASTFLMLLTPVLYPLPESGAAAVMTRLNPLVPLVTTTRDWLTIGSTPDAGGFIAISIVTVALLLAAWVAYRLALPHLIARLGN
jgi:lipopolysaccharide transport system permease protein